MEPCELPVAITPLSEVPLYSSSLSRTNPDNILKSQKIFEFEKPLTYVDRELCNLVKLVRFIYIEKLCKIDMYINY